MPSLLQRLVAAPPPRPQRDPLRSAAGAEPGLYGLGVGLDSTGSAPPSPIATVQAIIGVISQTCGQLPRRVLRADPRDRTPVTEPRFRYLTGRPHAGAALGGGTMWESLFASVDGWGNGYLWLDRVGSDWRGVVGLYLLMPQRLHPYRADDGGVRYRIDDDAQPSRGPDEIGHVAKIAYDGLVGMSPVRAGALGHSLTTAAERAALAFFRGGATVGGVVMHPEKMDTPAVDEFYDRWRRHHAGGQRTGGVLLLQGNAKYERIGIPPQDAQWLETRQFQREEILGWYAPGMPHHLLGWRSSASSWGTGVEQQSIAFVKYVLLSRLRRVEELVDDLLLPPDLHFDFAVEHLLRGDSRARSEVAARMRQWGALTADEWRTQEGLEPRGIPDDYLEPLNMERLDAATGVRTQPEPTRRPQRPAPDATAGTHLLGELRCGNAACSSRSDGRPGKLLARQVLAAAVRCPVCGETTTIPAPERLRDGTDLDEALDQELARRLNGRAT